MHSYNTVGDNCFDGSKTFHRGIHRLGTSTGTYDLLMNPKVKTWNIVYTTGAMNFYHLPLADVHITQI